MFDSLTNVTDPRPLPRITKCRIDTLRNMRYIQDQYMSQSLGMSLTDWIDLDIKNHLMREEIKEQKRRAKEIEDNDINLPDGKYLWMTINWDPKKFDLKKVKVILSEIFEHKYILGYAYNYEQRGKENKERGKGIHNHLLLQVTESSSVVKRMVTRKLIKLELIGTANHVNSMKTNYQEQKILYLQGQKINIEKDAMIEQDKIWRKEQNLDTMYTNFKL